MSFEVSADILEEDILEEDEDNDVDKDEYIGSFSWSSGVLAVTFYNLSTKVLTVSDETFDLRPQFPYLHNVFNAINPQIILTSGPEKFIKTITKIMNLPDDINLKDYKYGNRKPSTSNLVIFSNNMEASEANRRRVKDLFLPGMPLTLSASQRAMFIESLIPMDQDNVVNSLGNMLHYLDLNKKYLFLANSKHPIITDLKQFSIKSQVLIDNLTQQALQIFSYTQHPSAYKKCSYKANYDGFSLYNLFNQKCSSQNGSQKLKEIFRHPTCDLDELNKRYALIDWCCKDENQKIKNRLKKHIHKLRNINILFSNISLYGGKPKDWKYFLQTIYNVYIICKIIKELPSASISTTILVGLADVITNDKELEHIVSAVDDIFDSDESDKEKRFVVRPHIDGVLDIKREKMAEIQANLYDVTGREISNMPEFVKEYQIAYIPSFGFVLGIPIANINSNPKSYETKTLRYVFTTTDNYFYKTDKCQQLDEEFGSLYLDIMDHEKRIRDRLIFAICERLPIIDGIINICATLDCFMAMAEVATEKNYVKPHILECKAFEIISGRHPMLEVQQAYTPNDFITTGNDNNVVTILNSPNSSGKSVYMKQIGIIIFLAHCGCYVPASSAKISLIDAIYTQMYSTETVHYGTSSYLSDLQQTSKIIMNSSTKSIILIDEFGKGTIPSEGLALLVACIEHLVARKEATPIVILSTHYTTVYDELKDKTSVSLKTFEVIDDTKNEVITPTYRLLEGRYNGSYALNLPGSKSFIDKLFMNSSSTSTENTSSSKQCTINRIKIMFGYEIMRRYLRNNNFVDAEQVERDFNKLTIMIPEDETTF